MSQLSIESIFSEITSLLINPSKPGKPAPDFMTVVVYLLLECFNKSHNIHQRDEKENEAEVVFPSPHFFRRDEDGVQQSKSYKHNDSKNNPPFILHIYPAKVFVITEEGTEN